MTGGRGVGGGDGATRPAILYLDVDDEITTAAGRLRTAEADTVALVLPHGSRLATSRINFRLLAREGTEHGRRLAIVAPDASTRALAASAGLPVFASVSEFETAATVGLEAAVGDRTPAAPEPSAPTPATVAPVPPTEPADAAMSDVPPPDEETAAFDDDEAAPDRDAAADVAREPSGARRPDARPVGGSIPVVGRRRAAGAPSVRTTLVLMLVTALVIGGAVAGYVYLPTATVVVSPRLESVGPVELEIVADPEIDAVDVAAGAVPARRLTITVTASETFAATGKRVVTKKATGTVSFQNCDTGRAVNVGSGSRVSTDGGTAFETTTLISLPRATIEFPFNIKCSTKDVRIEAVAAGPDGNVAAGAITKIPSGYDPLVLRVTNAAPTSGGSRTEFPRIEQADVDAALEQLAATVQADFEARVADPAEVPAGMTLFPETARLGDPVPGIDPATLVGTEQPAFELGVSAEGTVIAVDATPVRTIAEERLLGRIVAPDVLAEGSLTVDVGDPFVDGELVRFPVRASASQVRTLDAAALKAAILGLPLRDARTALTPFGEVEVEVWPDWVTAIPGIDARVTVTVGEPVAAAP